MTAEKLPFHVSNSKLIVFFHKRNHGLKIPRQELENSHVEQYHISCFSLARK